MGRSHKNITENTLFLDIITRAIEVGDKTERREEGCKIDIYGTGDEKGGRWR